MVGGSHETGAAVAVHSSQPDIPSFISSPPLSGETTSGAARHRSDLSNRKFVGCPYNRLQC